MQNVKRNLSVLLIVFLALSFFGAAAQAENILGNGEFTEDIKTINNVTDNGGGNFVTEDSWLFLENAGAGVGEIDDEMFKVSVFEGGSNTYSIQLLQAPVEIKKGYKYKVEFDAKASKPRELELKVGGTEGRGWGSYVGGKGETGGFVAELDREMKSYEYEFVMTEDTDPKSRVEFQLGKQTGTIWLDNVSLTEVGEASADEIPEEQKKKWVYDKDFFFIFNVAVGGNLGGQVDTDFPKEMLVDYIKVYDQDGNLDWEDDFDGEEVNEDYWTYEVGNGHKQGIPGWGNNELQYYTEGENAHVEDSNLVITVKEEKRSDQYGEYDYTSTRMITQDKVNMKYGRVEIRAKLPEGQGLWPAFWMLGSDIAENPWPGSGEIDMMEFIAGQTDEVHGTVHGPNHYGGGGITQHYVLDEGDFTDGYHDFIFEWTPDEMRWYIDDDQEPYHVVERTDDNQAQRGGNPEEPEYTKNAVVNGEFNSSILDKMSSSPDNWYVWTGEGGAVSDYGVEDGEFKIDVSSLGNQTWAIQFAQYVDLDAGDYRLSFEARADAERDIIAMVQEDGGDWKVYGEAQPTLTSEMKKYTVDVSLAAADIPKLLFSLGNTDNGETTAVYIYNVKLEKLN
jgi:beta-glucanase (GH16 family)